MKNGIPYNLISNSHVGVFRSTPGAGGEIIDASPSLVKMFGYRNEEEIVNLKVSALFQDQERIVQFIHEGYLRIGEYLFKRKDGSTFCGNVSAIVVSSNEERVSCYDYILEDSTSQKKAEYELSERLKFEKLLFDLSAKFVNFPASDIDETILQGLRMIVESLSIDRCTLGQYSDDKKEIRISHSWAARNAWPFDHYAISEMLPWLTDLVLRGEIMNMSSLENLPKEAWREKEFWSKEGVKSLLIIPLHIAGSFLGIIGFCTVNSFRRWPEELIPRLKLIGEVFANALMRRRAESELNGAFFKIKQLQEQLQAENEYLLEEINLQNHYWEIVGQSKAIRNMLSQVERVASTDSTVLILGETGTGKELVARAIHNNSRRNSRTMVKVNCAALPSTLVESELFGQEKGAYTGAMSKQPGRFEAANGSTILLDEISEMPREAQAKLLRVLQEGQFERLGSASTINVDVRIIAASNLDLTQAVRDGRFRDDLYYRLNVFPIIVPPLRERHDDIPLLVWSFVKEFSKKMRKNIVSIPRKTMEAMQQYSWPGNVRELRNVVERAVILSNNHVLLINIPEIRNSTCMRRLTLNEMEKEYIAEVLSITGGRVRGENGAAAILGLKPTTLDSRMKKLGILK